MTQPQFPPFFSSVDFQPYFNRIQAIYADMDGEYTAAAKQYGFQCDGCADNCCMTRFYHHTLIEYRYLMIGLGRLSKAQQQAAFETAEKVVADTRQADKSKHPVRLMCPLNHKQRCQIYPFRPMICRLHGISHQLRRNDGLIMRGEGCGPFDELARGRSGYDFDRTPFYRKMALLEKDVRQATGFTRKFKMTIAEMLLASGRPE